MNKSPQYNQQQAEPKQWKFKNYMFTEKILETGHCMQHLYLKISSGFHARKNFSEETSARGTYMCIYIYIYTSKVVKLESYMKQQISK